MMSKSPFPGMDPFLEAKWPEVHARLIVYAANQINEQLPDDLQASIEENLSVEYGDEYDDDRAIRPDVHVAEDPTGFASPRQTSTIEVAEPLIVKRTPRDRHVEIVNQSGRVITAIEFLSPANKVGTRGREQYTCKQEDYVDAGANLVEVDLVREGKYVLYAPFAAIPEHLRSPYMACVYRCIRPTRIEIYHAPMRERLPNIPIPLRRNEPDVVLQLQPLIDAAYKDGRYYRWSYADDLSPPFDAEDAAWVEGLLREHGKRV